MTMYFNEEQQETLSNILISRRDVRGNLFTSETISEQEITKIIDAGIAAPSVGFSQPSKFIVIDDKQVKLQVAEVFKRENQRAMTLFDSENAKKYAQLKLEGITEAPVNIAVYYQPHKKVVLGQTSMPEMGRYSVVCAVQNMWLMARAMNIGIGWVSILNPKAVNEILNAPKDAELVAYLCVGKVTEFYSKPELEIKKWEKRKQRESICFKNRF